ncbi:phosphatidylserine lipase ABHD16A-like [Mya arenaria]|uniref:phosphatidylserine lipase ABHD16A-like n=1 Tax=Mya arenaria TaxID=6604 RepID=UPI0022E841D8|nr:phosphatidylserine lipase ABHD16A-like [Mya arenaria]
MGNIFHVIKGPRLFRIFHSNAEAGRNYEPKLLESGADKVIGTIRFCWSLSYWTSPLLLGILYRRGHFTSEGIVNIGRFMMYVGVIYTTAVLVRGVGRCMNPDYMAFITVLANAQNVFNPQNRRLLSRYDFDFWASPVLYKWPDFNVGRTPGFHSSTDAGPPRSIATLPLDILSYMCANTFGRRMMYPGATALINSLVEGPLCQGRAKLVEERGGERAKLGTEDENQIDTMFVDKRGAGTEVGRTLVVCSEGNAGFYEIGAMETPLKMGYSVLGWNHPGFAGSTGIPFPPQERHAIDAVMQYAIQKLGFTPDNIVVYAWSIGGYTATWAAMTYPDVKYMILDATFDEMMPLAKAKMPEFAQSLVKRTVDRYLNLNIAEQLVQYPGPILLIRRSRDEMITTRDPTAIDTNRGNFLLMRLLKSRYPKIVDATTQPALLTWLSQTGSEQAELYSVVFNVDTQLCETMIRSYMEENQGATFPLNFGEGFTEQQKISMAIFLAKKHLEDYDSTHCTPLPEAFFHKPWSPS